MFARTDHPGRPVSRWTRGVVASAALVVLTSCGTGPVEIDSAARSDADAAACRELLADLPATVADQDAREVSPDDALGAAWGDPAITLTCGVEQPAEFDEFSTCIQADEVGWYVPDDQLLDESVDVTMTAVGYRPRVRVEVPSSYRPEGVAAAMSEVGRVVDRDLKLVRRCQ